METEKDTRAIEQAKAQLDSIKELVNELRASDETDDETRRDNARTAIIEDALSVQVRSDWYTLDSDKEDRKPAEYTILLCTGGPACRIIGELDEYREPEHARIEYQDWLTPWQDMPLDSDEEKYVLDYARTFYFGE